MCAQLRRLLLFTPSELRELVCGRINIQWDEESLAASVKCSNGYTHTTPVVRLLFKVRA